MSLSSETAPATVLARVHFTPFKAEHALGMVLTEQARASMQGLALADNYRRKEESGPGWTMWADDEVVGCAGVMIPWPGVGHAWLLPSPHLAKFPRTVVMTVAHTLYDMIEKLKLRRIDCEVQVGFTTGERFIRALGFVPFGPVRERWGPNDDDYQPYVILQPREEPPHVA